MKINEIQILKVFHDTIKWGAEIQIPTDNKIVKTVKSIKQNLSRTLAANFHSSSISETTS